MYFDSLLQSQRCPKTGPNKARPAGEWNAASARKEISGASDGVIRPPEARANGCLVIANDGKHLEGIHCSMLIKVPAPAVVVISIEGTDVGELGDAPFDALAPLLNPDRRTELFIDARAARGPSIDVSSEWARWLIAHRGQLLHVSMLTGSRFVQLSASFVKSFADLGDTMRLYSDDRAFEGAVSNAVGNAFARERDA